MGEIKVSVVVPVHNAAPYLTACVESILNQTLKEIEIILVENGSSDDSVDVCKRIAEADPRIRFFQINKADLSTARNAGIKKAHGEYIGFVDSDDAIMPTMFSEMYAVAVEHGLEIVNCSYCKKYDSGKLKNCFLQDGALHVITAKEATSLLLCGKIPVTVWSNLYHRRLFDKMLFPTDMYFEDRASTFRFMAEASKVGIIGKALYIYYQRRHSITHSRNNFKKLRDYVTTDVLRLSFIDWSDMFPTPRDKGDVAHKTANHLIRKLFYMLLIHKTQDEKREYESLLDTISLIPPMTRFTLKQKLFLFMIKANMRQMRYKLL